MCRLDQGLGQSCCRVTSTVLLWLSISSFCHGNAGVFFGSGQSVELIRSTDIQMVSEEIDIVPGRGRFLFDGDLAGADQVEYDCKFVLHNHSERRVTIQVGFPLTGQFWESRRKAAEEDVVQLRRHYKFIAQEREKVYTPRYVAHDKGQKLRHLFLWDMEFDPGERKALFVSYQMPISMALSDTREGRFSGERRRWHRAVSGCLLEQFSYVTETGRSWKGGVIESAKFRLHLGDFERYLRARGYVEVEVPEDFPVQRPVVHRELSPGGWRETNAGLLELTLEDFVPGPEIVVTHRLLPIPQDRADTNRMIGAFREALTAEEVGEFEAFVRAYYGEKVEDPSVQAFLEDQIWYPRPPGSSPTPDGVLEAFEEARLRACPGEGD